MSPETSIEPENKVSPNDGGCWFCQTDKGEMLFDTEFDTWVHEGCLREKLNKEDDEAWIMAYLLDVKETVS